MNLGYQIHVQTLRGYLHESIFVDSITGNGLKRAQAVMRQENASRVVIIDSHGRIVMSDNGTPFDPLRQTERALYGTWADRAQIADGIARNYFKGTPKPKYPFWRLGNLWSWLAGILLCYFFAFLFAYLRTH